jgi:hypothetical protein
MGNRSHTIDRNQVLMVVTADFLPSVRLGWVCMKSRDPTKAWRCLEV